MRAEESLLSSTASDESAGATLRLEKRAVKPFLKKEKKEEEEGEAEEDGEGAGAKNPWGSEEMYWHSRW